MAQWRLNRLWFWLLVGIFFLVRGVYGALNGAASVAPGAGLNDLLVIALALIVGARLADTDRDRWSGYVGTFMLAYLFPLVLLKAPAHIMGPSVKFVLVVSLSVIFLAFLIWVGARPSVRPTHQVADIFD